MRAPAARTAKSGTSQMAPEAAHRHAARREQPRASRHGGHHRPRGRRVALHHRLGQIRERFERRHEPQHQRVGCVQQRREVEEGAGDRERDHDEAHDRDRERVGDGRDERDLLEEGHDHRDHGER